MIRVVVAEDSTTVRGLLVALLESDPEIRVVGQATNGREAIQLAEQLRPDLITMDIHMPEMDGLEATKEIMVRAPTPIIIVSSSASRTDVDRSLDAVRAGALMLLAKPDNPLSPHFNGRREQLLALVRSMAEVKVVRRWAAAASQAPRVAPTHAPRAVSVVAVGASTGGPAALQHMLQALPRSFPVPVLVVQHIASGFAEGLADWLAANCDLRVKLAEEGEMAEARTVYLAPDDRHLGMERSGRLALRADPPIGGHRPSATYLFSSVAAAAGNEAFAVVLSGMGRDGLDGARAVHDAGGYVIAQNRESSVVWGMPGEVVSAGLADVVLALADVGPHVAQLVSRKVADEDVYER